jgi:quinol monooxygenase YgiN
MKINCGLQVKEWGNLRFDVLENVEVPTEFLLIELYRLDAAKAFS